MKNWPTEGRIVFEKVGLRYNSSAPLSVQNVSFTIEPQEKVSFEAVFIVFQFSNF